MATMQARVFRDSFSRPPLYIDGARPAGITETREA